MYKLVELFRGKYFVEENTFNPDTKSIKSTLVSLDKSVFHRVESFEEIRFKEANHISYNIVSGHSYIRQLAGSNRLFKNSFTNVYNDTEMTLCGTLCSMYKKFIINNYLGFRV